VNFNPRVLLRSLASLFVLALLTAPAFGQETTAGITGRVLDQNGAAVPNATVTASRAGTGQSRAVQTNENGDYTISDLTPGRYEITVEAPNFSKALVRDAELNIGTRSTLNFDLKPWARSSRRPARTSAASSRRWRSRTCRS
jgi:protocatechuate 3,4-dioxygenase beta subunit